MKIGVYAGSFNPFHLGHLDIVKQAAGLFDKVVIAIGKNPAKETVVPIVPFPYNHPEIKKPKIIVASFHGLLADFLNQVDLQTGSDHDDVFLIRGLRDGEDLHYEQNQLQFVREMYPSLRTVFFVCDRQYEHISSSAIRQLHKIPSADYQRYILAEPIPAAGAPRYPKYEEDLRYGWRPDGDGV